MYCCTHNITKTSRTYTNTRCEHGTSIKWNVYGECCKINKTTELDSYHSKSSSRIDVCLEKTRIRRVHIKLFIRPWGTTDIKPFSFSQPAGCPPLHTSHETADVLTLRKCHVYRIKKSNNSKATRRHMRKRIV